MSQWEKTKGKLKEGEGKLTDDKGRETQGKAEQKWEDVKETVSGEDENER